MGTKGEGRKREGSREKNVQLNKINKKVKKDVLLQETVSEPVTEAELQLITDDQLI